MRTRELIAGTVLVLLGVFRIFACPSNSGATGSCAAPEYETRKIVERLKPVVIPEPSSTLVRDDQTLSTAYYDTMRILGSRNQCSEYFGGSESSVYVFSSFMASVKRAHLPAGIGVKMSGDYTNILNAATQLKFRLFDKTAVNTAGPFYQRKGSPSGPTIFGIGSFGPGTREARVLMLLHELGHLMKGSDGKWLLPDDGHDMEASLDNTRRIEFMCGNQIRELGKPFMDVELTRNDSEQTVSPAAATSSH
jgi:hypothetical protein